MTQTKAAEVIRVRELTYTYPKAAEPAVRGMDFSVGEGEISGFSVPAGPVNPRLRSC